MLDAQWALYGERTLYAYGTPERPFPAGLPHVRPSDAEPAGGAAAGAAAAGGGRSFAFDFLQVVPGAGPTRARGERGLPCDWAD